MADEHEIMALVERVKVLRGEIVAATQMVQQGNDRLRIAVERNAKALSELRAATEEKP